MKKIIFGLLALASTGAFANYVANGSFELGPASADPYVTLSAGSTALTSWSIDSGSIDLVGNYWQASDGVRSIDLSGNEPGTISQSLNLVAGQAYNLTFDFSGNPDGGAPLKVGQVSVGDLVNNYAVYDISATGNTHSNMMYDHFSATFVAGATNKLTFTSLNDPTDPFGLVIDNVNVQSVPEPMTIAVLGLGVASVLRRRKKV